MITTGKTECILWYVSQAKPSRVARWFVFKPKIPIWVHFGGPQIRKGLYILWPFGIFYGDLGYYMTIWYILYSFGTFLPVLVSCSNKNLASPKPSSATFVRNTFLSNACIYGELFSAQHLQKSMLEDLIKLVENTKVST
jgi:hypothetical protein